MSEESRKIAENLVAGATTLQFASWESRYEFISALTKILDESWNQGFEDALMQGRLRNMGLLKEGV